MILMAKDDLAEFQSKCNDMGGEMERLEGTEINACVLPDQGEAVLETGDRVELENFRE